jgi:UDP-glucose 4-epimerase
MITIGSLQEPDVSVPALPNSPYAAAKLGASAYARLFARVFGAPVTIVRPFMVYGPGQLDFTKLVPYVASKLLQGGIAELTSGKQDFDWVYVDDVIEALLAVGCSGGLDGTEVDVGTGTLTSVRAVVEQLASHLGHRESLRFGVLPDRELEPTRCADIETTYRLLQWRPKVALSDGLRKTAEWYARYFKASSMGLDPPAV